jgi:hypothetical protein
VKKAWLSGAASGLIERMVRKSVLFGDLILSA